MIPYYIFKKFLKIKISLISSYLKLKIKKYDMFLSIIFLLLDSLIEKDHKMKQNLLIIMLRYNICYNVKNKYY